MEAPRQGVNGLWNGKGLPQHCWSLQGNLSGNDTSESYPSIIIIIVILIVLMIMLLGIIHLSNLKCAEQCMN